MDEQTLQSEFGNEAILNRLWLAHLGCHGTQVAATIVPGNTEAGTLQNAWDVVRRLAEWTIRNGVNLPADERFELIVGWSRSVRPMQGQIFKTGGVRCDLQCIASSPTYDEFVSAEHNPLRTNWRKDVL